MTKPKAPDKSKPTATPGERLRKIGIASICNYVADGDSLRSWTILNGLNLRTTLDWINADEDRAAHYAQAKMDRADVFFDSLDEVSTMAVLAETAIMVAGLRLKADNIKWKLARMNSKAYGDKLDVDAKHSGEIIVRISAEDIDG